MALVEFKDKPSTNSPINADNLSLLQNNVEDAISDEFNKTLGKILWVNQNMPTSGTSSFAGQTINLEANNCDLLEIFVQVLAGSTNYVQSYRLPVGKNALMSHTRYDGQAYVVTRQITSTSNSSITFLDATQNGATGNTRLIPLYVVGYKCLASS